MRAIQMMLLKDVQDYAHRQQFLLALTAQVDNGTVEFRQQWASTLRDMGSLVTNAVVLAQQARIASSDIARALELGAKGFPWHLRPASPSLALLEQILDQRAETALGSWYANSNDDGQHKHTSVPHADAAEPGHPIGEAIDTALPSPDDTHWRNREAPTPPPEHGSGPEPGSEP
ncbi:hypothetical protein NDR87_14155 [Nocardia sp. CDC159]|uniref:Uncharacterized protein n=1 Tax=Nocardia pulmonis TaxID=2951408 RepID=A0A9X2EAA9_9NOCA|nr:MULTISPECIES: hypothetical protein [Nocardia]MCM6774433.1 hypothetical protein [Nocardia pulmonis]MCM6787501.1 hypothetical protein [Nocardia sp. CDC159]